MLLFVYALKQVYQIKKRGFREMKITDKDILRLGTEFESCQKLLVAIGDENRQRLIMIMLKGPCDGSRAAEIAERTNLSRPAVSHHIQILKDAGIVKSRKEGKLIYYYLDPDSEPVNDMIALFSDMKQIMKYAPERGEE